MNTIDPIGHAPQLGPRPALPLTPSSNRDADRGKGRDKGGGGADRGDRDHSDPDRDGPDRNGPDRDGPGRDGKDSGGTASLGAAPTLRRVRTLLGVNLTV